MITRDIEKELMMLLTEYPVVTILGPRQSGKTTLAKYALKGYEYKNLEIPENREFAENDPKAFLAQFNAKVIIDEIQRVPQLLSYIQGIVDDKQINGQFLLTGSHQLALRDAISQSLAGRTAVLNLLPLSVNELRQTEMIGKTYGDYLLKGFLPRIYDQKQRAASAYSNYYQTYVERDVRQLINLKNQALFEKFIKLMAGRVGRLIDYNSLANDVGVDGKTIKNWISILEASFIVIKLPPFFENFGKRLTKSPKYYFTEPGLLTFLLGIENETQLLRDPLIGNIFENLAVIECFKSRLNQGKQANLYYYRDSNGHEVDIIYQQGRELVAIEVKSSTTFNRSFLKNIEKLKKVTNRVSQSWLIYNGDSMSFSDDLTAIRFDQIQQIFTETKSLS